MRAIALQIVELEAAKFPHPTWYKAQEARRIHGLRVRQHLLILMLLPATRRLGWKDMARVREREGIDCVIQRAVGRALDEGGGRRAA